MARTLRKTKNLEGQKQSQKKLKQKMLKRKVKALLKEGKWDELQDLE